MPSVSAFSAGNICRPSLILACIGQLAHAGFAGVERYAGLAGTAHAIGSLVTGNDPHTSVVDPTGKVHGMTNLYIGDGSVLPRTSRVNPSLTIYAWGLRLGDHLAEVQRSATPGSKKAEGRGK